jgi:hypothetical protein
MSWVAVAVVGGSVVSAAAGAHSAGKAAKAGSKAADQASAEQARQYDQTREDFAPYREVGAGALSQLAKLYGIASPGAGGFFSEQQYLALNPDVAADPWASKNAKEHWDRFGRFSGHKSGMVGGTPGNPGGAPDNSGFFQSPDYQFNLDQGQQAIDRSLAARGKSLSGAGVKEGVRYASGMASQEFGNFYNRLANLAGIGQSSTGSTAAAGANAANNIGQNHLFAGQSRANGYMQAGQAINNGVQGGISNYMLSQYLKQPTTGGA